MKLKPLSQKMLNSHFLKTVHPFYITVDTSPIGLGAILLQLKTENKMQVIPYT